MSQSKFSTEQIQLKHHKGLSLIGYSRAAHRTGLKVIGLNILLDAGLDIQKSYSNVFITHQHLDHVIFLPQYTMNIENEKIMNVISTLPILNKVQKYLTSALRMSKSIEDNVSDEIIINTAHTKMIPISMDSLYEFYNGKERWIVESIECFHGVDSIGFGFSLEKIKLKEEYSKMDGKSIKKLKDDNIDITYKKIEPIFLFLGDTNKQILLNESIYMYPTIIIECTYIYEYEMILATNNHHICWNDIKYIIKEKNSIQFILIHFSMKYRKEEITDFFSKENLQNVHILI